jgi:hypothetical protein
MKENGINSHDARLHIDDGAPKFFEYDTNLTLLAVIPKF